MKLAVLAQVNRLLAARYGADHEDALAHDYLMPLGFVMKIETPLDSPRIPLSLAMRPPVLGSIAIVNSRAEVG